jgi:hypothetical protein
MAVTIAVGLGALLLGPSLTSSASAGEQLGSWQEAVRARAEVDLQNNFQSPAGWTGKQGWEPSWTFDPGGWAKPGKLALLGDSVPLANYQFEFLGQIDSKALGFAVRAIDENNYYAVKLMVVKPGPLPALALAYYPVIDGKEGPKTQIPAPIHARSDTLYRTSVAVQGDDISVSINGQFIGSWTDDRFKSGGVGFFADKGEASRLIWVHVVDQKDFLGWLCSQVSRWTADRRETGAKQ